ncbi:MAG: response regulator transcription factor [Fimbriimonadaceae bacterium]|nr:response regulator transcription factor [Fimbriimonadaceae bacterium]
MDQGFHILVVEDDRRLADGLRRALQHEGHRVTLAHNGEEGLALGLRERPDLVVLDLKLPDLDGLEVCQRLRQRTFVPIMIMTGAAVEEQDKVVGLRFGADDYLVKPFGLAEFCARVEALLRRSRQYSESRERELRASDLRIDREAYTVRRGETLVDLTPKEFELLVALAEHPNRVRTREYLLDRVWGYSPEIRTRTLDMHVRRLREKLERDPSNPALIQTVIGVGYKLVA